MRSTLQLLNSARGHTIGFIGVGRMGGHMLNNLIVRGLQRAQPGGPATRYVVCDPDDRCVRDVVERHQRENKDVEVVVAKNPHDLTLQSSTIISMIPKLTHCQSVYTSSSSPSVLSALKSGDLSPEEINETICMDESTVEMEGSRAVAQAVEETGAAMVDAPVSGGVYGAEQGTLTIMVGASSPETFERAKPTLELMGKRVIHCGGLGAGLAAKICNNMMLGISMLGLSEAMLLGKKLGLDQQILGDIINTSTGQSWASSVSGFASELDMERALTGLSSFAVSSLPLPTCAPRRFTRPPLAQTNFPVPHVKIGESSPAAHRDYANGFLSSLAHKDLVLALRAAESVDSPLYTGELTERVYREMMAKNEEMGQRDFSVVYKYLEEVVGSGSGKP